MGLFQWWAILFHEVQNAQQQHADSYRFNFLLKVSYTGKWSYQHLEFHLYCIWAINIMTRCLVRFWVNC